MVSRRLIASGILGLISSPSAAGIVINEFVVDPQQDWNGSGSITPSDEWFEIYNSGDYIFNMTGIEIQLIDTTPNGRSLTDWEFMLPGERRVLLNPEGSQNNNGKIRLYDVVNDQVIDKVVYGNWGDNTLGIPDGNAHGFYDESISRFPDGSDEFVKYYASYDQPNIPSGGGLLTLLGMGAIVGSKRSRN